jgi:hypothetical protein
MSVVYEATVAVQMKMKVLGLVYGARHTQQTFKPY